MDALKCLLLSLVVLIFFSGGSAKMKEREKLKVPKGEGLDPNKRNKAEKTEGKVTKFDKDAIEDRFIIQYKEGASASQKVKQLKKKEGRKVMKGPKSEKMKLVVADKLSDNDLKKLEKDDDVVKIVQDQVMRATSVTPIDCKNYRARSWGQDRLDQDNTTYDRRMETIKPHSDAPDPDVTIYILSTGLDTGHPDFTGRASNLWSYYSPSPPTGDDGSHGTFLAGIAGGRHYGIAKYSKLVGMKTLDEDGVGSTSSMVWGIWKACSNFLDILQARPNAKGVILIDGSMDFSYSVDYWISWAVAYCEIPVVVAAGNNADNVWWYSPAGTYEAIVVASSNRRDELSSFSNVGFLVDIIAPGHNVKSLLPTTCDPPPPPVPNPDPKGPCMTRGKMSGTSMAAAHVAGVAASWLQSNPNPRPSPTWIRTWLKSFALQDQIPTNNYPPGSFWYTTGDLLQVTNCPIGK